MAESKFIKQYGVGHKIQRLYIHWDITSQCEYKCSYCYARKEYEHKWNTPGIWSKQLIVLEALRRSKLPIFLGLLGGEPTSHYKYFDLINELIDIVKTKDESRLYITTNGAKDNTFFEKHPTVNNQIYFLFSLHPEYINEYQSFLNFKNNILILLEKGYRIKVNIMLHPSKQYWENLKIFINELKNLPIEIHPHFIYSSPHLPIKYSPDFYKFFDFILKIKEPEFVFEDDQNKYEYTDHQIFENKYNQFFGWDCLNNNFEIDLDCKVNQFCFEDKRMIKENYFENILEIKPKICPHQFCSCDGLLKIYKEKKEKRDED